MDLSAILQENGWAVTQEEGGATAAQRGQGRIVCMDTRTCDKSAIWFVLPGNSHYTWQDIFTGKASLQGLWDKESAAEGALLVFIMQSWAVCEKKQEEGGSARWFYNAAEVRCLIEQVFFDLRDAVDRKHSLLTGCSMGAACAWEIALRYPDCVAAVMPISGTYNEQSSVRSNTAPSVRILAVGDAGDDYGGHIVDALNAAAKGGSATSKYIPIETECGVEWADWRVYNPCLQAMVTMTTRKSKRNPHCVWNIAWKDPTVKAWVQDSLWD